MIPAKVVFPALSLFVLWIFAANTEQSVWVTSLPSNIENSNRAVQSLEIGIEALKGRNAGA